MVALVCVGLFKGLFWAALMPPWKVADEPAHFDQIQYRSERMEAPTVKRGGLHPVINPGASVELRRSWDVSQHLFRSGYYRRTGVAREERELAALARDRDNRVTDGQMPAINYPGTYYNLAVPAYLTFQRRSILTRLYAIRALSVLFGIVIILCTYFTARMAIESRALAVAGALVVALHPMESQMTAACNNDVGLMLWSALSLYLLARIARRLPELPKPWEAVAVGLTCGLTVMTKNQGVALLPLIGTVAAITVLVNLRKWRAWALASAAMLTLLVSGYPQIKENFGAYMPSLTAFLKPAPPAPPAPAAPAARPLAPGEHVAASPPPPPPPAPEVPTFGEFMDNYHPNWKEYLFKSFWGNFGWLEYALSGAWLARLHKVATFFWAGSLALAILAFARPRQERRWFDARVSLLCGAMVAVDVCIVMYAEYYAQTRLSLSGVIQGRNFLFGVPALGVLIAAGMGSLVPARLRPLVAGIIILGMLALHIAAIVTIARYNYVN